MADPICRLIPPEGFTINNALTLVPWLVGADSKVSFNRGFPIVNGATQVHVPLSGIYRIDCGLSYQTDQPEGGIMRLLIRVGGSDRVATGARARASNIFQGPQASTMVPIEIGEPVEVRGGMNGGSPDQLSTGSTYLCMQYLAPL